MKRNNHIRRIFNWNKRENNGNSDDNQKEKLSIHNRYSTPNSNRTNSNNCDRLFQSYEKVRFFVLIGTILPLMRDLYVKTGKTITNMYCL